MVYGVPHLFLYTKMFVLVCSFEIQRLPPSNVTSTPGHVLTTSLLRPKKIKDVVRTWYGLVGRGRNVVRT